MVAYHPSHVFAMRALGFLWVLRRLRRLLWLLEEVVRVVEGGGEPSLGKGGGLHGFLVEKGLHWNGS
jgi:hypothetical protein